MKYFYFAVSVCENGKRYAYAVKASGNDNILSKLKLQGIESANICETKKKAGEIATFWNQCYKANGTYLFDDTKF